MGHIANFANFVGVHYQILYIGGSSEKAVQLLEGVKCIFLN
jgi:hypothetical protein